MRTQQRTTPNHTHANATMICETALKAMGLEVESVLDYRDGYDFKVNGKVRVAVRYAFPMADREQIYRKRNGEISRYVYKRWTFNFHRHGKLGKRYCDFFVCFLASSDTVAKGRSEVTVFVIPWDAITGLTFCSSTREGSNRPYRGKYARYQDAWELIERAIHGDSRGNGGGHGDPTVARKQLRVSADSRKRLEIMTVGEGAAAGPAGRSDHQD